MIFKKKIQYPRVVEFWFGGYGIEIRKNRFLTKSCDVSYDVKYVENIQKYCRYATEMEAKSVALKMSIPIIKRVCE